MCTQSSIPHVLQLVDISYIHVGVGSMVVQHTMNSCLMYAMDSPMYSYPSRCLANIIFHLCPQRKITIAFIRTTLSHLYPNKYPNTYWDIPITIFRYHHTGMYLGCPKYIIEVPPYWGCTWDVPNILVLWYHQIWGTTILGMYLGCTKYPGILSIKGSEVPPYWGCTWEVL